MPINFMSRYLLALFSILVPAVLLAQTNQVDSQGRKHGVWEEFYQNGTVKYRGEFSHGQPVGEMKRYYDDGSLQAVLVHRKDDVTYAELYYPEKKQLMAEGKYLEKERDSVWTFYSQAGVLTSREAYSEGEKQGLTEIYYEDGSVSEKIHFVDDVKHGVWEQYFPDGNPKLKATVVDGVMYDGEYITYYPDGTKMMEGEYVDGKKESSWYHFNEDGSIEVIYVYRSDKVVEKHFKNGTFETYWPNDIKRSVYSYKDGEKHGPFQEWYNQGEWRDEERVDNFGNRYPVQKLYDTQLRMKGKYRNGELHGEVIYYDEDGSVEKTEVYQEGELID